MTEQNQTPDPAVYDDTEGHHIRSDGDEPGDDTERHRVRSHEGSTDHTEDDVEGHQRRSG